MLDTLFQNCAPDFSGQIINICIPLPEVVKNTFLVIQGTKARPRIKAGWHDKDLFLLISQNRQEKAEILQPC